MIALRIIDTFPDFLKYWHDADSKPVDEQIEGWANVYMSAWPELLALQQDDYTSQGLDWREIAREKVFPHLPARLHSMQNVHGVLLDTGQQVISQVRETMNFEGDVTFIIYVGIGCGAGWVTGYEGMTAILFGLENIVESSFNDQTALTGLIAHEVGHVIHFQWRDSAGCVPGVGPWWQLFTEGFAQRCEHLILEEDLWHMGASDPNDSWLTWCLEHRSWLAQEWIETVERGLPVNKFFGSWFEIMGKSQTGYFLGHEIIRLLENTMSIQQIALLDGEDPRIEEILRNMAASDL